MVNRPFNDLNNLDYLKMVLVRCSDTHCNFQSLFSFKKSFKKLILFQEKANRIALEDCQIGETLSDGVVDDSKGSKVNESE